MTKFNQSEFSEAFRSFTNSSVIVPTQTISQCNANDIPSVEINNAFNFCDSNMLQRFGLNQQVMHVHHQANPSIDMIRTKDQDILQRSNSHHLLTHTNLQLTQMTDAINSFQQQQQHQPPGRHQTHHPEDHRAHSPDSASLTDYDESSSISSEEHVLTPLACASAGQSRPCLTWACKACKKKSVAVDRRKAATLRERRRLRKVCLVIVIRSFRT